jgi:hypothetical protein
VGIREGTNQQVTPCKLECTTIGTYDMSCDVLFGCVVLCPLKVTLDFQGKNAYYHLGWV